MKPVLELIRRETSAFFTDYDREGNLVKRRYWEATWKQVGWAKSLEDAKEQGFVNPVLDES